MTLTEAYTVISVFKKDSTLPQVKAATGDPHFEIRTAAGSVLQIRWNDWPLILELISDLEECIRQAEEFNEPWRNRPAKVKE